MTYKEYLYYLCSKTDMEDSDKATRLAQMLVTDCLKYNYISKRQDEKLKEILTAKQYDEFVKQVGRELFEIDLDNMPDCDFKDFCKENMGMIMDEAEKELEESIWGGKKE